MFYYTKRLAKYRLWAFKFQQVFASTNSLFCKLLTQVASFFPIAESQNINTIITLFAKKLVENIAYGIADV